MFTNDPYPRATNIAGLLQGEADWHAWRTFVGRRASIGSNATVLSDLVIGAGAMIAAGAVATRDVPSFALVAGVPARAVGDAREREARRKA